MKVADEPAYLTVGTDVSAKYRGAFCEAKIKTVKRMVKVKVVLKGDSTSQVVQDDQVKGPLRVGSTVEVKSPEGRLSEAIISKLTDASWYTVVFDDGDEKTLRRTSLCLKGERHFAESETLDQLPLTNPEHFGTPVIGKKKNRGRRSSQAVAEDEKESSSSEDDEDDRRRLNDDLLGKVACVQSGSDGDSWHYVLVISPSCNDDLTVKKDQCLVRSFADSKFASRSERDFLCSLSCSLLPGFEAAQRFVQSRQVPDNWKVDLSEILESSSSDEEDDNEDGEGKVGEEEVKEPEPEEVRLQFHLFTLKWCFLQKLNLFIKWTPINKSPVLGYKDLNLFKLFRLVHIHGGCDNIESGSIWKQIYMDLGIPVLNSAASYNVKTAYRKYLYGFEEYCRSAQIQFRTVHHNEPRPDRQPEVQCVKTVKKESGDTDEMMQQVTAEPETSEDKPAADADESDTESEKGHKDICSPRGRRRCTVTPVKVEAKEPVKQENPKEEKKKEETQGEGENSGEEQKEKSDGETPGKRRSRHLEESDKDTDDEEQEDDEDEEDDGERSRLRDRYVTIGEDDGCEDSVTGTKVKVKYGKGKTQKIYEANIKNTETDDGESLYLVHYYGWNVRYDEWVKADRIIWPVDKGGTKRKQKKKVKNKEDEEKEKEEDKQAKQGIRRGRPPLKSTPPSTSHSVSKTPSSEGRSSSKSSRPTDASALPNGEEEPKMLSPVKTPLLEKKPDPEKKTELVQKPAEHPSPTLSFPSKDIEMKSEMPALTREVHLRVEPPCPELEDATTTANEEMMPQIGPEALVCHEVDLDDPEEKDRPSGEELLIMMKEEKAPPLETSDQLPHVLAAVGPPRLFSPSSAPSPDESHSTKSESDATIEVDSVAESQEGLGENESTHSFDASASSSNSSISLQDRDGKDRGQKRLLDCTTGSSAKRQKRSQKRSSAVCKTEKNGAGHSSDSEDLSAMDSSNKLTPVKHSSLSKSQKLSRSPGLASPNSKDMEKDKHKQKQSVPSPRTYKWSCQLTELDNMTSAERISFLQEKLQEIRKYYMSLKSEVASIDRRRKRLKKKEREVSHTTASTSSGSSDTGMSPSSASPTGDTLAY
uniref:AT-rich interactive domain-containing protein 4A-like n=1 Tax=Sinocyclocheilus anshuiensis TaxID=1608454 RepID=A0A671MF89_9TELE